MSAQELPANQQYLSKILLINTTSWIRNQVDNLYNAVSAPVAVTRDALCIKLPQMIGYVRNFDSNKTMSFKVSDNKLLKYNKKVQQKVGKN